MYASARDGVKLSESTRQRSWYLQLTLPFSFYRQSWRVDILLGSLGSCLFNMVWWRKASANAPASGQGNRETGRRPPAVPGFCVQSRSTYLRREGEKRSALPRGRKGGYLCLVRWSLPCPTQPDSGYYIPSWNSGIHSILLIPLPRSLPCLVQPYLHPSCAVSARSYGDLP